MLFDETMKNLGRTITDSEVALGEIDKAFVGMYETAAKYALDIGQIDVKKAAARTKLGTDFADMIARQMMDPLTLALTEIGEERTNLLQNNSALMAIVGYQDQAANIEALYSKKRLEILKQHNDQVFQEQMRSQKALLDSLNDFVKSLLPGGGMAGEGLREQLEGLTGTRDAARARAMASPLDEAKVNEYVQAQADLLEFQKSYFGGDERYQDARMRALEDARIIQEAISRGLQATEAQKVAAGGSVDPEVADLLATQKQLVEQINILLQSQRDLNAKLARKAAQGG
jgi:hypothetical protein